MEPARRGSVLACALALVACLVMASATILAGSAGSQAAIAPFGPVSVRVSGTLLVARAESRHGARSYAVAVGHRVIPVQGPFDRVRRSTPFRGRLALPDSLTSALAARGIATTPGSVVDASSSAGRQALAAAVRDATVLRVAGTPSLAVTPDLGPSSPATHHIYVAAASNLGPLGLTDAQILADVSHVADYWQHQANGAVSAFDVAPTVLRYRARAARTDCGLGSDFFDVVREAAARFPGIDLSGSDQLVVLVPDAGSCSAGNVVGEGSVGDSFASGGAVVVRAGTGGQIDGTLAHETGHNYGLQHANVRVHGRSLEYYGVYDVMGFSLPRYDQLTALSTPYRVAEGVTDPGEIATVDLGDEQAAVEQTWTIQPRSDDSGLRSVRVRDPDTGRTLYLDYRCGCGEDTGAAYQAGLVLRHGRRLFRYHPGVVLTAARGGFGVDDLALPSGATSLATGATWRNRSGNLSVRVDSLGAGATVTVDFTPGLPVDPAPTPGIAGDARIGSRLHAVTGTWLRGATIRYQWFADGVAVPGATRATFTPTRRERGLRVRVRVTGSRAGYHEVTRASGPTARVGPGQLVAARPTIIGRALLRRTLVARTGRWTDGTRLAYRWYADGRVLRRATGPTLRLARDELGARLRVEVTGRLRGYVTRTRTSGATPVVR